MLPDFLKEYKEEIDKSKLDIIRIKAIPLKTDKSLSIKRSKLLGLPYLPLTEQYPINKFGKPLTLFAQINFEEMPTLKNYPSRGIFQVFVSEFFWDCGNEYFLYKYHQDITQEHQTDFSFLENLERYLPIEREHELAFSKEIDYGGEKDFRFHLTFNGISFDDFRNKLSGDELKQFDKLFNPSGHKIGGYAYFTQCDPRKDVPERINDVLLLQIDSDEKIMWGDAGISNIFINADDLKNRRFYKSYFNWDCA